MTEYNNKYVKNNQNFIYQVSNNYKFNNILSTALPIAVQEPL